MFCSFDYLRFRLPRRRRFGGLETAVPWGRPVADVNHNFPKDSSIQLFWRFDAENLQNCWRKVDITTREIIRFATLKIRAGSNQCVVHVESAECSVSPLSCRSLPIRVDHPRNLELIF